MQNLNALVVDDSKVGRLTMMKKLEALGIQVRLAESGQEALDSLEESRPDMIFMDHMMPDMDGFETTRRIKSSPASRHIPVIVISGNEGEDFVRQAREAGALDAIVKPPADKVLEQLIAALPDAAAPPPAAASDAPPWENSRAELLAEMDRRRESDAQALAQMARRLGDLEQRFQVIELRLNDLEAEAGRPAADLEALRAELNERQARVADPKPMLEEVRHSLMALVADHAGLTAARNSALDLRLAAINEELTRLTQDLHAHGAALATFQMATPQDAAPEIQELRAELRQLGERWDEPRLREVVVDTLKHLKSARQAQDARDAQDQRAAEPPPAPVTPPSRGAQKVLLAGAGLLAAGVLALYLFLTR